MNDNRKVLETKKVPRKTSQNNGFLLFSDFFSLIFFFLAFVSMFVNQLQKLKFVPF